MRLREAMRPLAEQLLQSLESAGFESPSLSIENYHWGFELSGTVIADPGTDNVHGAWARFAAHCGLNVMPNTRRVQISARYERTTTVRQVTEDTVLWSYEGGFLAGGSEEERVVAELRDQLSEMFRPTIKGIIQWCMQAEIDLRDAG